MKKYDLEKFKGIIIALYACFGKDGNVDTDAVKKLSRFYLDKGVTGLYVCGSSGEGLLQTVEERKRTLEAVMDAVGGKLRIIVHVGAIATRDSIELAKHAEKCGADAVSAIPNVFYHLPESSIQRHWERIIDSTDLPFIIYNIPQLSGYDLSIHLLQVMAQNPKVIGVKNTSMSAYQTQMFSSMAGKEFLVFNGPDEQYLAGRIMGASAGIGGTYGIMPELFVKMENSFRKGDFSKAQACQFTISNIITQLYDFPSLYGVCKEVLKLRGVDIGTVRPPFEGVSEEQLPKVKEIYDQIMSAIETL